MKSIQVDSFQNSYKVIANYRNTCLLAESVAKSNPEPFVVWHVGHDGTPYGGFYTANRDRAQQEFCERCFGSWFETPQPIEEQLVDRQEYDTHWTARYHGWFLAQKNEADAEVVCFLPSDDWEGCAFPDLECLMDTYEPEWQASTLQEAMDFIDSY